MRFVVKVAGETIGFSELEGGDAGMGCAFGRFVPTPAYSPFQRHCIENRESPRQIPGLTVETAAGVRIDSSGGAQILDYSRELGEEGLQIHVLGVTNPPYDELFPNHVAAYEKRWK